jgi:predicted enzyme related to lactoylglutathione lyase
MDEAGTPARRVTGIGGIFFKARDPDALRAWYRRHLGFDIQEWGGTAFQWDDPDLTEHPGATVWSLFPAASTYFAPSEAPFMVNYRVADLAWVLGELRAEGCDVDEKTEESEYGKFGWVMDPEGNRIELWEPPLGRFPG